jgi:arginine decarboxylase
LIKIWEEKLLPSQEKFDRIKILPKHYFVVSGVALSPVSALNAFDEALKTAGIYNLNLVKVSSILPKGVTHLELTREEAEALFEAGEVVFTVQACVTRRGEKYLSAGLIWGEGMDTNGLVIEHAFSLPPRAIPTTEDMKKQMVDSLVSMFQEGVRIRNIGTKETKFRTAEIFVPKRMYGCALVSLVLC